METPDRPPSTFDLILPESYREHFTIKAPTPALREKFGGAVYGGVNSNAMLELMQLPGGSMLAFDLSKLTLADFRQMRDHYQVTISLWILQFMLHQLDWRIECDNAIAQRRIEENFKEHWPRFIAAISTSFWAGSSPNILQYDNHLTEPFIQLDKIKDVAPEWAEVNWKVINGYTPNNGAPHKISIFDGMKVAGNQTPIPVENSFWYPLLMENGNMNGRKLLRAAFPAYFFSQLMHLFSNRYFERFGEPVPIGRYPQDTNVTDPNDATKTVSARQAMITTLEGLRSRGVVALPSDREQGTLASGGTAANAFEWDIEYLESQMRGADFERYLLRLDEEISLALFTPVLMYRTTSVGSYNLGDVHMRLFLQMLNAIAGDIKLHIDRYILDRLVDTNFGVNAPRARWIYRRLGRDSVETVRTVVQASISAGLAAPDLEELSIAAGMEFHKPTESDLPPPDPNAKLQTDTQKELGEQKIQADKEVARQRVTVGGGLGPNRAPNTRTQGAQRRPSGPSLNQLATSMIDRVTGQINAALRDHNSLPLVLDFGYEKQLRKEIGPDEAARLFDILDEWWSEFQTVPGLDAIGAVQKVITSALEAQAE
jgi:hypothetical protein